MNDNTEANDSLENFRIVDEDTEAFPYADRCEILGLGSTIAFVLGAFVLFPIGDLATTLGWIGLFLYHASLTSYYRNKVRDDEDAWADPENRAKVRLGRFFCLPVALFAMLFLAGNLFLLLPQLEVIRVQLASGSLPAALRREFIWSAFIFLLLAGGLWAVWRCYRHPVIRVVAFYGFLVLVLIYAVPRTPLSQRVTSTDGKIEFRIPEGWPVAYPTSDSITTSNATTGSRFSASWQPKDDKYKTLAHIVRPALRSNCDGNCPETTPKLVQMTPSIDGRPTARVQSSEMQRMAIWGGVQ